MTRPLKARDTQSWIDTIWTALTDYRENHIPEGVTAFDKQWDDICTAMAWITEELGLPTPVQDGLTDEERARIPYL